MRPRPDEWGDNDRTLPCWGTTRLGIQGAVRTERLRPLAALNARSTAATSRGHRHLLLLHPVRGVV
jgi:hypothetical protein